jgi:hypothetical protein
MIDLQQAIGCMINVPEKNKRMMDLLVERGWIFICMRSNGWMIDWDSEGVWKVDWEKESD